MSRRISDHSKTQTTTGPASMPTGHRRPGTGPLAGPRSAFWCLVVICALVGSTVPAAASFPSYDDVPFTWSAENTDPGPSGTQFIARCQLASANPLGDVTPCEALRYEIGNSDTHVFFRWTLASVEFSDSALELRQGFRGSGWEEEPAETWFEFTGVWESGGTPQTTHAEPGDWSDAILWDVIEEENQVVAAVPLEQIGPMLDGGAQPGSFFNVTTNPRLVLLDTISSLPGAASPYDEIPVNRNAWNGTFSLSPYLNLQPPPQTFQQNATGLPLEFTISHDAPTLRDPWLSDTYVWNWTLNQTHDLGLNLNLEQTITNGTLVVNLTDPNGDLVFTSLDALPGPTVEGRLPHAPAGNWTLELQFNRFVGNIHLTIEESPEVVTDTQQEPSDREQEEEDPELESSPAPGIVIIAVTLGVLLGLHRRSRSRL